MERISTFNINTMSIGGALKVQSEWAKAEMQQSSGLVSQNFIGLSTDSRTVLSLSREIEQAQSWAAAATDAQGRTEVMYSAIGAMTDVMTNLRTTISAAISSPDNSSLLKAAQTMKDSLLSQMNKQYNGLHLFAGSNTDEAPVDVSSYPSSSPYDATVADTSYYTGDDTTLSVRISSEQTVSYGVTANNPAFEKALRAVEAVIQAATSSSTGLTAALQSALTVANQATTELSNLQADVSISASSLKNAAMAQTTYVTLLKTSLSDVKNVDAAEVAVRVATLQTQLTASYSAVSDIAKMSLVKFL
ncbi:MAG: flagellin [Rhodospirillaceae bacterium]|nr:flagellin [Rhodospirillaceae bacterium]